MRTKWVLFCLLLFSLSSCQTNMLNQFSKVQPGMDKHDVIEIMGSPTTKTRLHNKDRWIYNFYADKKRYEKEVHFSNSDVVYAGDSWVVEADKSAATIDQKNEELNNKLDSEDKARKIEAKKSFSNFEDEMTGKNKVIYMPDFKPAD